MAMDRKPSHGTAGLFSVGVEATINLGNYSNKRVMLVRTFDSEHISEDVAYAQVNKIVDGWVADIKIDKRETANMVSEALPPVSGFVNQVMDVLKPYAEHLIVTDAPKHIIVKAKGFLKREIWQEINVILRAKGGKWLGTREGQPEREVHWEIPK